MITDMAGKVLYQYEYALPLPAGIHHLEPVFGENSPGSYLIMLKTNQGTLVKKLIRTGL